MTDPQCSTCSFKSFTTTPLLSSQRIEQTRELLRAHAPPPEHIESTLSELASELTRYDHERTRYEAEIDRLQAAMNAVESERGTLLAERAALQVQYDDCQALSLPSPVRRLPVEILLAIFSLSSRPFAPEIALWAHREKHRLAHAPLFALSRVCARWHDIIMGTPALWSSVDFPDNVWANLHRQKMLVLLKTVLKLSDKLPINVVFPMHGTCSTEAVNILLKHSERWKTASFSGSLAGLLRLSKGRMPLLESLQVRIRLNDVIAPTMHLFNVAPKLTRLVVTESLMRTVAQPHLQRLQILECVGVMLHKVTLALSLMAGLSPGSTCRLQLHLGNQRRIPYIDATSSNIGTLLLELDNAVDITDLLTNLNLPLLQNLTFRSRSPLPWSHAAFLGLGARSSFSEHLRSLDISDFSIAPSELGECLTALHVLERLEIADDERAGAEPVLTDSFLSSLTVRSESEPLLPSLRHLVFRRSHLAFSHPILLDFILSRIPAAATEGGGQGVFEMGVYWLQGRTKQTRRMRTLEPEVSTRIRELCIRRVLVWRFESVEERGVEA